MSIISENLIKGANDQSFFGGTGNLLEREANDQVNSFESYFDGLKKRLGGFSAEQLEIIQSRKADFTALIREQYSHMANFRANNPSWMVAGPAKYNFARHEKRMNAAEKHFQDYEEKAARFVKNTEEMILKAMTAEAQVNLWRNGRQPYGSVIQSNDPLAVEKMEAHIEHLEHIHSVELVANKWIRAHKSATGCPVLNERQIAEVNADIERYPYRTHTYFFTTQGAANIRNKKQRLEQLKKERELAKAQAEAPKAESEIEGVRMENNHEAARVQIIFDGIPSDERRNLLKSSGFRWSPRFKAWQRQNTPNGIYAAELVMKKLKEVA